MLSLGGNVKDKIGTIKHNPNSVRRSWGIKPVERVKQSKKAYTRERINARDLWDNEAEGNYIEDKYGPVQFECSSCGCLLTEGDKHDCDCQDTWLDEMIAQEIEYDNSY